MEENKDMSLEALREDILNRYGGDNAPDVSEKAMAQEQVTEGTQVTEATAPEGTETAPEGQAPEAVQNAGASASAVQNTQSAPNIDSAMQFAAMRDENARLSAEVQNLRQQVAEAQAAAQQNAVAANTAVSEATSNTQMPSLNMDELMYASEEERQEALNNYNRQLIEIAARQATADMLGKISPLMKQYDLSVAERERNAAMDELSAIEGFADIKEHSDAIYGISSRPEFANMPMSQRMTLAALIERGMRASAPQPAPVEPDVNAQADAILANPELMKVLTQKQTAEVKERNAGVPTHTAGGGYGNAAFVRAEPAKSFDEVRAKYGLY